MLLVHPRQTTDQQDLDGRLKLGKLSVGFRCAVVNNVPVNSEILSAAQAYAERNHLTILMDKYVPSCLEVVRTRFKPMVPMPEICHLQMLCRLLDCLLTAQVLHSSTHFF